MAALDNLIDLLEKLKETDPDYHDKASEMLDSLMEEEYEDDSELQMEPTEEPAPVLPEPKQKSKKKKKKKKKENKSQKEPEAEEGVEGAEKYNSSAELQDNHLADIIGLRKKVAELVSKLGLLQQNYEADKDRLLESIDNTQEGLQKYVLSLYGMYNLDPGSQYILQFPTKEGEKASFVRG